MNLGNIYFEQQKYSLAIKNYRMALDQVPQTGKEVSALLTYSQKAFTLPWSIVKAFVHGAGPGATDREGGECAC